MGLSIMEKGTVSKAVANTKKWNTRHKEYLEILFSTSSKHNKYKKIFHPQYAEHLYAASTLLTVLFLKKLFIFKFSYRLLLYSSGSY